MSTKLKHLVLAVALIGVPLTALSACTTHHDRFHNNFDSTHQQFYEEPYARAEDRRHDRDGYRGRYDNKDSDYNSIFRW
jgi:hypothetical protein